MRKIILLIIIIFILKIIDKKLREFKKEREEYYRREEFFWGFPAIKDLLVCKKEDFFESCEELLVKYGYNIASSGERNKKDIKVLKYEKNNLKGIATFVYYKYDEEMSDELVLPEVKLEDIQEILGIMISKNIDRATVITQGKFPDSVIQYLKELPSSINIELVDGYDFCERRRAVWI
jgi:Restriction endonuclease.